MIDVRFMYKLMKANEKKVRRIIEKELEMNGYEPLITPEYIYAPGTVPVLLVAHYDTVFKKQPRFIVNTGGVLSSDSTEYGIGADDRAGIYAVLTLVRKHHCHVLFTGGEEVGGVGAEAFTKDFLELPVNYMIQFDRRNEKDAVYYDLDSEEFEKFVTAAGFETAFGSFTDISVLAPHFGVAAVNLSVGYQNEHTASETLNLNWLDNTIYKAGKHLLIGEQKYEYVERARSTWEDYYDWYYKTNGGYSCYYDKQTKRWVNEWDRSNETDYVVEYFEDSEATAFDEKWEVIRVNPDDPDILRYAALGMFMERHPKLSVGLNVSQVYEDYDDYNDLYDDSNKEVA